MTYTPRSDFLHVMQTRGFVADCTDMQALDEALALAEAQAEAQAEARAKPSPAATPAE